MVIAQQTSEKERGEQKEAGERVFKTRRIVSTCFLWAG